MNYVLRVMRHRHTQEERQKELETNLSKNFNINSIFLAKKAGKKWDNKKKQNLNSSMKLLRDELHAMGIDSD